MPRQPNPHLDPEALRRARKAKGWTPEDLAHRASTSGLNVCASSIQAWEADYYGPNAEKLEAIARALGVKPTSLLPAVEPRSDMPKDSGEPPPIATR